jgi:hypothetical protein
MPLITHIDVEVRPSIGFQTVGYTARVQFDAPLDIKDALVQASAVREALTIKAHEDVQSLVEFRLTSEAEQKAQAPQAPVTAVAPAADGWAVATKPKGGQFRYLTTAVYSIERFKADAIEAVRSAGIDVDSIEVWDDRTGKYGLESGNEGYTAGKVKAKEGTSLHKAMQGKAIIGGIEFNNDGTLRFSLSRDGKAAVQALQIAGNLKALDATPF